MRVELKIPRVDARRSYGIGEIVDVSPEEAKRLIEAGKAAPVREERESAVMPAPEARKKKRSRRSGQ